MKDKYQIIGHIYGLLSAVYSGPAIQRCREAMFAHIKPGDKVLFAGVGYGEDAIKAAALGANVTIVELSSTMLNRFRKNRSVATGSNNIREVHDDIMNFCEFETYDHVFANFFLNIFDASMMRNVLRHLVRLSIPGGNVIVGDFIYPSGNALVRLLQKSYWYLANVVFWVLADNPVHQIYNYPAEMASLGLKIREERKFKLLAVNCFWSVAGVKPA